MKKNIESENNITSMISLIICEGFSDLAIIGGYLEKKENWACQKNPKNILNLPESIVQKNNFVEYRYNNDIVVIWNIEGQGHLIDFEDYLFDVQINNELTPTRANQCILFMDSDSEMVSFSQKLQTRLQNEKYSFELLNGNVKIACQYEIPFYLTLIPYSIPSDKIGCLEDLFFDAIKAENVGGEFIYSESEKYIKELLNDESIKNEYFSKKKGDKYSYKERLRKKAHLSSILSIVSNVGKKGTYSEFLASIKWSDYNTVCEQFTGLNILKSANESV